MQGAISLRQESYDRNVATGTLQQKMGRIAPYTQRYSAPQRLHPPVSFADSPPWQGGPRGLSNPANKAKAAHESAKSHYPHIIQFSTTKHKNSCRRSRQAITWRVPSDDRWLLHESPGVQGSAPPWCFSPGFSRKAGKNQGSFALDLIEQPPGLFDLAGQARNQGGFALD